MAMKRVSKDDLELNPRSIGPSDFRAPVLLVPVLLTGCHVVPVEIPSTLAPSREEAAESPQYVGKKFITAEESYLYRGFLPTLSTRVPNELERPIRIPANTPFTVRRIEINQGKGGNMALATVAMLGGGALDHIPSIDALYVDLHLPEKSHRNVKLVLRENRREVEFGSGPRFEPYDPDFWKEER